jgi:dynein heavy chain
MPCQIENVFSFDQLTNEWVDGVLARIMRDICAEETVDQKWVMFDGPVDTLWIESMNTLLDDNKILTLLNGERINMPAQVCTSSCVIYI